MPPEPAAKPKSGALYVSTDAELADLCARLRRQDTVALDVEFVWRKTYFPRIALIQVAGADGSAAIVDPLTLSDTAPLAALLDDPAVLKLLHSGSQDLMVFQRYLGTVPCPWVDTQIAAALVGMGYNIGYAALIEQTCGVTLAKGAQTSDWLQRPLTPTQITYAANEVTHLIQAWGLLRQRLTDCHRLDWAFADSADFSDSTLSTRPAYQGVSGWGKLTKRQLAVLVHLADWREAYAQSADRPVRWIIEDAALIDLAVRQPTRPDDLTSRDLPDAIARRNSRELLAAIRAGRDADPESFGFPPRRKRPSDQQHSLAKTLMARIRAIAEAHDIPPELVAPRRSVESLAYDPDQPDHPLLNGWRGTLMRDAIAPILADAEPAADD